MTNSLRTLTVAALVGTTALGLSACGGSDKASTTATTTSAGTSTATTTPAATTPAATEAASTPAATTPSAAASSAPAGTASVPAGFKAATGKGFTFAVPATFTAKEIPGSDIGYMDSKPVNGFSRNVGVIIKDAQGLTDIEAGRSEARAALEKAGTEVKQLPDTTIDGEKAIGFSTALTMGQIKARNVQYFTLHGGKAYFITYNGAQTMTTDQLLKEATPMLSAWKWTA